VLPTPPSPKTARGTAMREVTVPNDRITVASEDCEVPWAELGQRLPEAACVRLVSALEHSGHKCGYDELEKLWLWENPTSVLKQAEKAEADK
jgi:hypothetical protein